MTVEAETKWNVPFVWGVLGAITLVLILAVFCYSSYRHRQLDAQAPVVQTCVTHRVTQKVSVTE